jgi:hypothetical protein
VINEYPADGTIEDAKAWVNGGGDPVEAYETESSGKSRSTLLTWLADFAGETEAAPEAEPVEAEEPAAEDEEPAAEEPVAEDETQYRALKRMHAGGTIFNPGDIVTGAAGWSRVESYVRSGWLEEA